jgi:hypothetical protein
MTFVFWCLICGAVCTGLLCAIDVLIMLCSERELPPPGWYPPPMPEPYEPSRDLT